MPKLESRPVSSIKPDPNQPRKTFDESELRLLGESLRQRQNDPIQIMPDGTIIDGERRWRAAKLVGLEKLDVIVTDQPLSADELAIIRLTTFLHREGLQPYEEWQAIEEAMKLHPIWDQQTMAKKLGLDPSSITRKRSPSKCSAEWQTAFKDGKVTFSDCYAASKLPEEDQAGLLALKLGGASRDQLESAGRKKRSASKETVRVPSIKIALPNSVHVTIKGDGIDLEQGIEALKDAVKAMTKARDTGLDAKTAQAVWRDMAAAS